MEPDEYIRLAEYETWYWWYRAERRALVDAVRDLGLAPAARVLDAGCGTGRNLAELTGALDVVGVGVDASVHAARRWNAATGVRRQLGSVNALPFGDATFDAVVSVDVLCCDGVDPACAMAEFARVVRARGAVVLLVPAYQGLLSRHDAAVHCVRRFNRKALRRLMERSGLTPDRMTHLFAPLLPVVAGKRWWDRRRRCDIAAVSDLSPLPGWLNGALFALARAEQVLGRFLTIPVGSTILAVARKDVS